MTQHSTWKHSHLLQIILLTIPLLIFGILKAYPELDVQAWSISWYTSLIQFYTGSFASLIALIAALFASSTVRNQTSPRTIFVTFAFVNIAALMLISSIATPNILVTGNNEAFSWSLRLAFPTGAAFFALASIRWSPQLSQLIVRNYRPLWGVGFVLLTTFAVTAFAFPETLLPIRAFSPFLPNLLAILAIVLMLFASWRTWKLKWPQDSKVKNKLSLVLILLSEAQLFQTFGMPGHYSWLIYHPVMLIALMIAVFAILSTFEAEEDIQANRYFAALGSILIAGLSLIIGEVGTRWVMGGENRTLLVPLVLIQGALSFLVLYSIVLYLNRLITERTLALRREQRHRSELTQLIVHDLKSPLSVITSGINLLNKGNLGTLTATQSRLLASLEQSGQQILFMIDDLLDVERLEAGKLALKPTSVNVIKLLRQAMNELELIASIHNQSFELNYTSGLPSVPIDKQLMWRVFTNLLTNALKFTPEEGKIEVSVYTKEGYLTIEVADSGPGVPEKDRERIFAKFGQVEGSERRGAGLGLTFCKMVVEAHDGQLTVNQSHLGGALFQVKLPIPLLTESESTLPTTVTDRDLKLETS